VPEVCVLTIVKDDCRATLEEFSFRSRALNGDSLPRLVIGLLVVPLPPQV
jgi:hypothetical protein